MSKKLTIVGRGTAGCLSVIHFSNNFSVDIDWVYDPDIPTASVGEGTTTLIPDFLNLNLGFHHGHAKSFNSTIKKGILKNNWSNNPDYAHVFPMGTVGMHFSASDFQNFILEKVKAETDITVKEQKVNIEDIDSDFIMSCTGTPDINDEFLVAKYIPVNSCIVKGFSATHALIDYTLCIARPHGWIFGIPLTNRISFGYLYNRNISAAEEVEKDFNEALSELEFSSKLEEIVNENKINFNNYLRKENFIGNTVYNGNASFFLEPLEATSTTLIHEINRHALTLWDHEEILYAEDCNLNYHIDIEEIESMICLHYLAGSKYNTPFWTNAQALAMENLRSNFLNATDFAEIIYNVALKSYKERDVFFHRDVGTWNIPSYIQNIEGLGIEELIIETAKETGRNV